MENKTLVENTERWLDEEEMIVENYDYYAGELKRLLPVNQYGIQIQLSSDTNKTKYLDLNRECIKALEDFFKKLLEDNDNKNTEEFHNKMYDKR
jgi:hypothetical protein